jgi:hypothetical protein
MALSSGGVKDARRIPQPPPAVGRDAQLRGERRSRRSPPPPIEEFDNNAGGRLAWHGRQRTPSSKWVRGIGLRSCGSFRLSFGMSKRPTIKNKAHPLSRGSRAESAPLTFARLIYCFSEL